MALLLPLLLLTSMTNADVPSIAVAVRDQAPTLDDFGDAPLATGFKLLGKDEPAQAQTRLQAVVAGSRLVVRFECLEPQMDQVRTTVTARDGAVYEDDAVELFLAPVADEPQHYYHFLVNAAGVGRDEQGKDETWNCSFECQAKRGADRWWALLSVPLDELDYGGLPGEAMAVNLTRERKPVAEVSSWSPVASSFHEPDHFGRLTGLPEARAEWAASSLRRQVGAAAERLDQLADALPRGRGPVFEDLDTQVEAARRARDESSRLADQGGEGLQTAFERLGELRGLLRRIESMAGRAALAGDGNQPLAVVPVSTMRKVAPGDPLEGVTAGPLRLSAARGESESAQAVVVPLLADLRQVNAEVTPLAHGNQRIAVELRRVDDVNVTQPSGGSRWGTGPKPDPLVRFMPFDLPRSQVRSLWLTVAVPRDAPAGDYQGSLSVSAEGIEPVEVPVTLTVYDFPLPVAPRLRNVFQLSPGMIAQRHQLSTQPGVPPGWTLGRWVGADVEGVADYFGSADFGLERVAIEGGGQAVELTCRNWRKGTHEGPRQCLHTQPIELEAGVDYEVSLRYRVADAKPGVAGTYLPGYPSVDLPPSAAWSTATRRFTATADHPETRLYVGIYGDGTVWYDDVRMTRVGSDENLLPAADFEQSLPTADEMVRLYRELLLEYRCSDQNVARPTITYEADDHATIDWSAFDDDMEHYLSLGLNAFNISWVPLPGGWGKVAEFTDQHQVARCRDVLAQTQAHLEQKGWLDLAYLYVIDEPGAQFFPQVRQAFELVGDAAPKLKRLLTFGYGATRPWKPGEAGQPAYAALADVVDVFVPHSDCFDPTFLDTVRGRDNNEIWCYVCISAQMPYANIWAVDYPGAVHRALFWQMFRERITGFLYWNATYWTVDPWTNPLTYPGGNGDGSLLYPGDDGPVPSQRLAIVRDGLDDYDYLSLLQDAVAAGKGTTEQRAEAAKLLDVSGLTPNWTQYPLEPGPYEARREAVARLLENLVDGE